MLTSIICPSRGRPMGLFKLIQSIVATAQDISRVELLVRIDDDDESLSEFVSKGPEWFYMGLKIRVVTGPRGGGYADMHLWVNTLAEMADGRWVWLLNDDGELLTKGWDTALAAINPPKDIGFINVCYRQQGNIFPMVTKTAIKAMGHFSLSPHNDSYIVDVVLAAKIPYEAITIEVAHYHTLDTTRTDTVASQQVTSPGHSSTAPLSQQAAQTLRSILNS